MYFAEQRFYPYVAAGKPIPAVLDYEKSGWHYGISSINDAQYVAENYTWDQFGANAHPGPLGQKIYADAIKRLFATAWKDPLASGANIVSHHFSALFIDPLSWYQGHIVSIDSAKIKSGWKYIASWKPFDTAATRADFVNVPVLEATAAGATLTLSFTGTAIGVVVPAGPDAGMLEFYIDGNLLGTFDQFRAPYSKTLHVPWTIVRSLTLPLAKHELTLKTSAIKNSASSGFACRIIRFSVSGP
jgi:hypothetical protein